MQKKNSEWYKDTEFWEYFAPVMFDAAHWAEVPAVTDGVTRLARFNLYGETSSDEWHEPLDCAPKVLDICCGTGRISAELSRSGFDITGVDFTESFLNTAIEDAQHENLNIEYILADAREFVRPHYFDAAVNLYVSFGYFADQEDDFKIISNAYKSLKDGGSFIIETLGKEISIRDFVECEWFERDGYTVMTEYKPLDSWTFLKNRWILLKGDKKIDKTFSQRLYAASEFRTLFKDAGFSKVEIYGDWDESPYDQYAKRLIAVGRKKP